MQVTDETSVHTCVNRRNKTKGKGQEVVGANGTERKRTTGKKRSGPIPAWCPAVRLSYGYNLRTGPFSFPDLYYSERSVFMSL
jgi:hypothetical protein